MAAVVAVAATGAFGSSDGGTITTIAGGGTSTIGDGGPATSAKLYLPEGVAVDGQGNVYIADSATQRVRKVNAGGTITTFAGGGSALGDGGHATSAQLKAPSGVALDAKGNLYIADFVDSRVRKVSRNGTITAIAGTGKAGFSGDGGPATSAKLRSPRGVTVDGQGNVYIADSLNDRVRKVSRDGTIATIAGGGSYSPSLGDGGPATSADLGNPHGVAVDGKGNVYVADTFNDRVRRVSPGGTITTFVDAARPFGVAVDGKGNVYIGDTGSNRVRKVSRTGKITTIAGTGRQGFSGDGGPATSAKLYEPEGVTVDEQGNLYIADTFNRRVRRVGKAAPIPVTGTPSGIVLVNGKPYPGGPIPYGSKVDVTKGAVKLTSSVGTLTASGGGGITAQFILLRFKAGGKPIVELRLSGGNFGGCARAFRTSSGLGSTSKQPPPKTVRRLYTKGKGSFRTRGKYASSTIRGTDWLTADRCDGTLIKTRRGIVAVFDLVLKKTVLVKAGQSYLAKKP